MLFCKALFVRTIINTQNATVVNGLTAYYSNVNVNRRIWFILIISKAQVIQQYIELDKYDLKYFRPQGFFLFA